MKKQIAAALLATALTSGLPLNAFARLRDDKPRSASGAETEYVSVTASLMRADANKKNSGAPIDWDPDALAGKTLSILGDSISSYRNYTNRRGSRWSNSTIGRGRAFYSDLKPVIALEDTWWYQLSEDLGLRLLVNNSWAGSTILERQARSLGAYVDRCVQLHDNTGINDGAEPDIIIFYMGANDYGLYPNLLGTADIDYDGLISVDASGAAAYAEPKTTLEAAAIILDKIERRYPLAEVYLMELPLRADAVKKGLELFEGFNRDLGAVAEHFGVTVIPVYDGPITVETAERYYVDARLHPNALGMDVLTEAAKKTILEHTRWTAGTYHPVTIELTDTQADYGAPERLVRDGEALEVTLTPAEGKKLTVTVTMDGKDVTAGTFRNNRVTIQSVTGPVTIHSQAK